jgi:hypothetical protein
VATVRTWATHATMSGCGKVRTGQVSLGCVTLKQGRIWLGTVG